MVDVADVADVSLADDDDVWRRLRRLRTNRMSAGIFRDDDRQAGVDDEKKELPAVLHSLSSFGMVSDFSVSLARSYRTSNRREVRAETGAGRALGEHYY